MTKIITKYRAILETLDRDQEELEEEMKNHDYNLLIITR